jgi:serine protease Do
MSKRTAIFAVTLVAAGVIFGAVIVTSFSGINFSLADGGPRFNTAPLYQPSEGAVNLNETFINVSSLVTPTVVSITVKTKSQAPSGFFWPFGDVQPKGRERVQKGSGSGIILTADGYILTNRHVIENAIDDADGIKVTLNDSRDFNAKLIGSDVNTDIAVIKIDSKDLSPASLGNSDEVRVGEWVLAVGNPLTLTSTVTAGIVSAISRNIGIMQTKNRDGSGIENFIQTDAAINPGNSGGALVNLRGQVVGVNTAIESETGRYIGYGFAVPINLAKTVADGIIKDGKFVRGYIGVTISNLDSKKANALGMDRYKGVIVDNMLEDGAGKAAGLKAADVIVEVDGKEVRSANELQARVGMHHPGESVKLKIFRDGKYSDIVVKLKPKSETASDEDEEIAPVDTDSDAGSKSSVTFEKAGFTIKAMDAAAKKKFDRQSGVIVTDVKQYSPSFENNLQPGVVIFEARKGSTVTRIEQVGDLKKILKDLGAGESVLLRVQYENGNTNFVPIEGPAM